MSRRLSTAAAFETLPVPAFLLELDGTILGANVAACRIADRIGGDGLVGLAIQQLAPDLAGRWRQLIATAVADGQAVDEVSFGSRYLQLVVALADVDSRPIVQAIAIDVTERKLAEAAARKRADAEVQAATTLRLESLGVVAGGIAHDFNNLLVGVLAEASAARETDTLLPATHEALRRIEAGARRMAQLTRQLLAFSGKAQLVTIALDADALVRESSDQLAAMVREHQKLAIEVGASGAVVEADASLLRQVVVNLVANAADAGASRVDVRTRIGLHLGNPCWLLEVIDDGAGIESATLGRIFEPFFTTRSDRHGLGLSAVHGIVRRLSGDIEVDTHVGRGTRFCVRLPILPGAEPVRSRISEPQGVPALKLAGVHVLVADDEPSVRSTVRRLLERRGATVVLAADGTEAEAHLRAEKFGLVILDIQMPGRTGHEVLDTARKLQRTTPVVLMSGYTNKIRGEGSEEEADAFLEKPFSAKALDAMIDRVLSNAS